MTEEIIIYDVNVAKCEFFDNGEVKNACLLGYREDAVNNFSPNCDDNPNCYYKQLIRLEQEWDELKFENDRYKQLLKGCPTEDEDCGLCVIDAQNKELKQENERLKELNTKICEDCAKEIKYYWTALEEIKEIINQRLDIRLMKLNGQAPMIFNADFFNKIKQPILYKIDEVLNENK